MTKDEAWKWYCSQILFWNELFKNSLCTRDSFMQATTTLHLFWDKAKERG
jgi:hypothetical protein